MWDKLRRERDHHRMHHRRVVQEKDKLINDIRRLKTHIDGYSHSAFIVLVSGSISLRVL